MILRRVIWLCLLLVSFASFSQGFKQSYTDPCTGIVKSISVPSNGIVVTYYGQIKTFYGQDFSNGTFDTWAKSVYSSYGNLNPCGSALAINTVVNVTQINVINILTIMNALSMAGEIQLEDAEKAAEEAEWANDPYGVRNMSPLMLFTLIYQNDVGSPPDAFPTPDVLAILQSAYSTPTAAATTASSDTKSAKKEDGVEVPGGKDQSNGGKSGDGKKSKGDKPQSKNRVYSDFLKPEDLNPDIKTPDNNAVAGSGAGGSGTDDKTASGAAGANNKQNGVSSGNGSVNGSSTIGGSATDGKTSSNTGSANDQKNAVSSGKSSGNGGTSTSGATDGKNTNVGASNGTNVNTSGKGSENSVSSKSDVSDGKSTSDATANGTNENNQAGGSTSKDASKAQTGDTKSSDVDGNNGVVVNKSGGTDIIGGKVVSAPATNTNSVSANSVSPQQGADGVNGGVPKTDANGGGVVNGETKLPEAQATQATEEKRTNLLGGTVNSIQKATENGKPQVIMSADFAGFNFRNGDVSFGGKGTAGYTTVRWDGTKSHGLLLDYTSQINGPNLTAFRANIAKRRVDLYSLTGTVGFYGKGSAYATLAVGQMWSFPKVKGLKAVYMAASSFGQVYKEKFIGTALIAGGMYDLRMSNRFDLKIVNLFIYAPYVSYHDDLILKSPYVLVPIVGTNIAITKKFKFNVNFGGAYSIGDNVMNFTIMFGTRFAL